MAAKNVTNTANNGAAETQRRIVAPQMTPSDFSRPVNLQRIAQKKDQVKSYTRRKKLEKLGVYSSCKVLVYINYLKLIYSFNLFKRCAPFRFDHNSQTFLSLWFCFTEFERLLS